jgi:uncharacterized membrane protein YgaE (UPF0421/DUF939 family)
MSVAAGLSWFVAHNLIGHTSTYFAPVASTIVLGVVPGERSRRAVEMVLGIALGIGIGDVIIQAIGSGALQISLVVLLAVGAAIMLGGGRLIASQAAGSAVLIAALPSANAAPARFVDALVGGFIGLAVLVVAPRNPLAEIRRALEPALADIRDVLVDVAAALDERDAGAAARALTRANAAAGFDSRFEQLLRQARETALLAPAQWTAIANVERYTVAAPHIGYAMRNVRVLARAARTALEAGDTPPAGLSDGVRELALAVEGLPTELAGRTDRDVVEHALRGARLASAAVETHRALSFHVIVGQVRSVTVDLLRALGVDRLEASARVRASTS